MVIAVKGKLRATGACKLDDPHLCHPILLLKRVTCINEDENLVLIMGILLPQEEHRVYA